MTEHIPAERALFLAALEDRDQEKQRAWSHAAGCADCQRLVRESELMLGMIDRSFQPVHMDAELGERVRQALAAAEPPHDRRGWRWQYFAWLAGVVIAGGLVWLDGEPGKPTAASQGLRCLMVEHGFALLALAGGFAWSRRSGAAIEPLRGSVVAMTGALIGQAYLRVRCEAADAALHLLVFHLLGVVIATLLGGLAARALAASR